jgi:hypothetical protein
MTLQGLACVSTGAGGAWHPWILADQLTLFKQGGKIMPTTLPLGTRGSKILTHALKYLLALSLEMLNGTKAYLNGCATQFMSD